MADRVHTSRPAPEASDVTAPVRPDRDQDSDLAIGDMIQHEIDLMFAAQVSPEAATHRLRVAIKTIRALLRLARRRLTWRHYRDADRFFRDLAGRLRCDREADVRLETLARLAQHKRGRLSSIDLNATRSHLLSQAAQEGDEKRQQRLATLRNDLNAQRARIAWQDLKLSREEIIKGLRRSYRRARRAYRSALDQPSGRNLHAWRKACKTLTYQLVASRSKAAPATQTYPADLSELGNHLGHIHDLSRLAKHLRAQSKEAACVRVADFTRKRMKRRAKKALAVGAALFASASRDWLPAS